MAAFRRHYCTRNAATWAPLGSLASSLGRRLAAPRRRPAAQLERETHSVCAPDPRARVPPTQGINHSYIKWNKSPQRVTSHLCHIWRLHEIFIMKSSQQQPLRSKYSTVRVHHVLHRTRTLRGTPVLVPEGTYIYSRALHKWRRAATNPAGPYVSTSTRSCCSSWGATVV